MYRLEFSHDATKALVKMPRQTARLIRGKLDRMAADPHAKHQQSKPLKGSEGAYRLRVGDWRVVYEIEHDRLVIVVIRVAPQAGGVPMSEHQIIYHEGKPAYVLVPVEEWERLAEDASDAQAVAAWRAGNRDTLPADVVDRLLAGENPVGVLRRHRGLSQAAVAEKAGINSVYLSQIETGTRRGSVDTLQAIARALEVPLEVLTGWRD